MRHFLYLGHHTSPTTTCSADLTLPASPLLLQLPRWDPPSPGGGLNRERSAALASPSCTGTCPVLKKEITEHAPPLLGRKAAIVVVLWASRPQPVRGTMVHDGLYLTDIVPRDTKEYDFTHHQFKHFYNMCTWSSGRFDAGTGRQGRITADSYRNGTEDLSSCMFSSRPAPRKEPFNYSQGFLTATGQEQAPQWLWSTCLPAVVDGAISTLLGVSHAGRVRSDFIMR
ncbi:protein patched homolog 1 [Lates japonicus]|uniref:Protein patched homolog 1 n=1 Tax=Lates japonicus TaxID=270547 RepID=A0AAD3M7B1_LATJO|nr:protein patched homolog 1 [Lates japonicus]